MSDPGDLRVLDELSSETVEVRVSAAFITGKAGTGKSYNLIQESQRDHTLQLCSTTGISAINLGTTTLNSVLRFFDTTSLRDAYLSGRLTRTLHELALVRRVLAVDEASMLEADQLDIIYRAVEEANRYSDVVHPLAIRLVGDFAQLPPVQGRWAFEADSWRHFAAATTRLDKVWRQGDGPFLDALNHAREGHGGPSAELLTAAGIEWHRARDEHFDGTTILPKNDLVNRHNALVLAKHPGRVIEVTSRRWGKQRGEWGENKRTHEWGIPRTSEFKLDAYVMILSNDFDGGFVNGDCGWIRDFDNDAFQIELVRNRKTVNVTPIVRHVDIQQKPEDIDVSHVTYGEYFEKSHTRRAESPSGRTRIAGYVLGQVEFYPLRLAWASTVHKSQGLSLDRCQIDYRDRFFGAPAMAYVALSRVRTLAGLRLVGPQDIFIQRVKMDERVRPWI